MEISTQITTQKIVYAHVNSNSQFTIRDKVE